MLRRRTTRALFIETLETRKLLAAIPTADPLPEDLDVLPVVAGEVQTASAESPLYTAQQEASSLSHQAPEVSRYAATHHEPFLPNFAGVGQLADRMIVQSSEPGRWAEQFAGLPASAVVIVNHEIVVDQNLDVHTIVVGPGGTLRFDVAADVEARLVNLQVLAGGTLQIGTPADPVTGQIEIVFKDESLDTSLDPGQYGNGLIVQGTVRMHGRPLQNTFLETAASPQAGSRTLEVSGELAGWQAGDELLLPDTRQVFYTQRISTRLYQYEQVSVTGLADGRIGLAEPLRYSHQGSEVTASGTAFQPHVVNLTRNVVLRSENGQGTRGYAIFMDRADVDIRYVEFENLGRTTNGTLDETVFAEDGTAQHVGSNPAGRYPVHFHHVAGPRGGQDNGYQFTFTGNAIHNDDSFAPKWGLTLHDSSYGRIHQNVIYNTSGAGIVTEDGSEISNQITENFISRISGTRGRGKFTDGREGAGIWLRRPLNVLQGNVVSGAEKSAYAIYGGDNTPAAKVRVPAYPGADILAGEYQELSPSRMHMQGFENNQAYASHMGLEIWYLGFDTYYDPVSGSLPESVFKDLSLWHVSHTGVFGEQANHVTIDGLVQIGSRDASDLYNYPTGVNLLRTKDVVLRDVEIQHQRIGIRSPIRNDRLDPKLLLHETSPFLIDGGFLNNQINFQSRNPVEDASANAPPRHVVIKDVRFEINRLFSSRGKNIQLLFSKGRFANLVQQDVLEVINFNQQPGESFQLYRVQQAADYLVPRTSGGNSPLGAPVSGMTNAELQQTYQLAIGGEVAPGDGNSPSRMEYEGVDGWAFPLQVREVQPAITTVNGRRIEQQLISQSNRLVLAGHAQAGSTVTLKRGQETVGTTVAGRNSDWTLDLRDRPLPDGRNVLSVEMLDGADSQVSPTVDVLIYNDAPVVSATTFSVRQDAASGHVVGSVPATDPDHGDRLEYQILEDPSGGAFRIDPVTGGLTVRDGGILDHDRQPQVTLRVRVVDIAGQRDEAAVTIDVQPLPPGQWVTELRYPEFDTLTEDEVPFLTEAQIASIPNLYWLRRLSSSARSAFTVPQIQALQLSADGMITALSTEQREVLLDSQIQSLIYRDLRYVPASRSAAISPAQLSTIPDVYWFSRLPGSLRDNLTAPQVQGLDLRSEGLLAYLRTSQIEQLSDAQVRQLHYRDFAYLTPQRIAALSPEQVATIPDPYWFLRISAEGRAALTAPQVNALDLREGLIKGLRSEQVDQLSVTQVQTLIYRDFRYLTASTIVHLSADQLAEIPDKYWYDRIAADARAALREHLGAYWLDGQGIQYL